MKLYSADHVLPIVSPPISDGAVLVAGAKIAGVGKAEDLRREFPDADEERFAECALLPGFVNCHSHLELTALRGSLDDLDHDFPAWLIKLTRIRAETLNDEDIADSALAGALEGIRSGVTCFGDVGRWGDAGMSALAAAGLRGVLFQETDFSPDDSTADEDLNRLTEKIDRLRERSSDRVQVGVSPHSPYTVSPKLFGGIARLAEKNGLKVTIHAAESDSEQELLTNGTGFFAGVYKDHGVRWNAPGMRAVEYLGKVGILSRAPLLAHCTKADENEVGLIAESGSRVAHCPKSNAKFGHGVANLGSFLSNGITVGLGTDSMVSNNLCDMFEEARFAALAARIRHPEGSFIQPAEALRLATLGGAEALGIESENGSLEPGKQADLIAVSLREVARMPVHDVNSALLFASRASDVVMTMVGGKELYRDGECGLIDQDRLRSRMAEIAAKVGAFPEAAQG